MKKPSSQTTRWFFILISVLVLYLFWQVVQPFAVVLITAGIAAILLSPIDRSVQKLIKSRKLSALAMILGFLLVIVVPLFIIGVQMVQEASDIIDLSIGDDGWVHTFDISQNALVTSLPEVVQEQILEVDVVELGKGIAGWALENVGRIFSSTATLIFHTFIFFIALYYFLVDRKKIHKLALDLSPFTDKLDDQILKRISLTVRSVMLGALVVALAQAIFATIGLTIFGVPGALLWGSLVIIAAQVPMLGVALIMGPAVAYLFVTGHPQAAIGLLIWSVVVVGLVDNVLSPKLIGSKTKMNELMILVSILGGLQYFGAIGFILGPTILAAVMVVVELYKNGMLENGKS
ncbi:AI-2E family transporter [Candidatus Uhrbacteria bacterium]|jgi:predicted PurR-regulated permease PerM|nr:AI-2E family transporter [Candidatus Uhrbacteria bacterium]MBT6253762.1 AI-2E family transporter [Candidatus Uhrbacteria bacterium]